MPKNDPDLVIAPGHPGTLADPAILAGLDAATAVHPPRPGLITEKSPCCNADIIIVGRGLQNEVCQKCGQTPRIQKLR
ncbi:MAG: hypothetical protein WC767_01545 [Candidatus Paceibacterota bacterium]